MVNIYSYTGKLLRNFQVKMLDEILNDTHPNPKEYRRQRKEQIGTRGWEGISDIINSLKDNGFDDTELEKKLFEDLTENLPDNYYIYDFVCSSSCNSILTSLQSSPFMNKKIYTYDIHNKDGLQIVSIRKQENSNKITILFRYGYTYGDESDNKSLIFFIPCILDFDNNLLIIKVRETHRKKSKKKINEILRLLIRNIKDLNTTFSFNGYGKRKIHETLYKMFKVESIRAEEIMKTTVEITDEELNIKIDEFLTKQLEISCSPRDFESYSNRIKSIYYQNLASQLRDVSFGNRYMFAFAFFDGLSTKSTTRDAARFHVYYKKLYWTLKDLIHQEKKITVLSMYYKFNPQNYEAEIVGENFLHVETTYRESYGSLLIDLYNNNKYDPKRREKSEYIISELRTHL